MRFAMEKKTAERKRKQHNEELHAINQTKTFYFIDSDAKRQFAITNENKINRISSMETIYELNSLGTERYKNKYDYFPNGHETLQAI